MQLLISGNYNAFSEGYNAAGIYLASGLIPSESYSRPIYVGSAVNFKHRIISEHIPEMKRWEHCNEPMQNYVNKNGIENLVWYSLETYKLKELTPQELLDRENVWFDQLKPFARLKQGFNIPEKAGSSAGRITSEETKLKISQSLKAKITDEERARRKEVQRINNLAKSKAKREAFRQLNPLKPKLTEEEKADKWRTYARNKYRENKEEGRLKAKLRHEKKKNDPDYIAKKKLTNKLWREKNKNNIEFKKKRSEYHKKYRLKKLMEADINPA